MRRFWTELWFLLLYVAVGLVVVGLIGAAMNALWGNGVLTMHLLQWVQNVALMILPAVCWVRFYKKEKLSDDLYLRWPGWTTILLTVVLMLVALPMFDALAQACESLPLPQVLYDEAMRDKQTQDAVVREMLSVEGIGGWVEALLLMAVVTAVGEECLFRGTLLRCFVEPGKLRGGRQIVGVALAVGAVFSLCHGDVFGFVPRLLLGALFVVLVWRTGSLWTAVVAHAINNTMAVVEIKAAPQWLLSLGGAAWVVCLSGALSVVVLWCLFRVRPRR